MDAIFASGQTASALKEFVTWLLQKKPLHIDIPVKLADAKVCSVSAPCNSRGLAGLDLHMQLIEDDIAGWDAKSEVVAVFHTNAGSHAA